MPRIINEDLIAKIADFAGRGYSKSATGRELKLDRATVRKYWPEEEEESEVAETPEVKLSLEDEFRLLTSRNELGWDINETLSKIEDRRWETPELTKKGQLATESLRFLKGKVQKAETLDELGSLSGLVNLKCEELKPILEEDDKLEEKRLEREEKERKEEAARRRKGHETLWQYYLAILPWYIPCRKYIEDVVRTFLVKNGYYEWAEVLGSQLALVDELKWEDDMDELEPLSQEFLNIITGHPEEKDKIIEVMAQRRLRILTARDEDIIDAFNAWLNSEEDAEFVEGALKLAGIFWRLAKERYIDIDELMKQEASPPKEPAKDKRGKADKARRALAA
ncbi:MAG: hypothetical protein ISS58_02905 [Dehalococcoidales bacterium]|nr:hypothetical protein [Dehalococcoidales bacterium]